MANQNGQTLPIDGKKLEKFLFDQGYTNAKFAAETGLSKWSISQYINNHQAPSRPSVMAMCGVLGIKYEDIKPEVKAPTKSVVSQVLENNSMSAEIKVLNEKIDSLAADMGKLAAIILDIQKVSNEAKAQAQLNHDELTAIFNKATDISSATNKVLGKLIHKY